MQDLHQPDGSNYAGRGPGPARWRKCRREITPQGSENPAWARELRPGAVSPPSPGSRFRLRQGYGGTSRSWLRRATLACARSHLRLAKPRTDPESLRAQSVTYVLGINRHLCDRNRPAKDGGEAGIRTLGTGLSPYNGLANRRFRPLSHLTGVRDERRGYRTGGLDTQAALRKLPQGSQGLQQLVAASLRTRRGIDTSRLSFFLSEPAAGAEPIASSAAFRTLADAGSDGISSR